MSLQLWCLEHQRWWAGCKSRTQNPGECIVMESDTFPFPPSAQTTEEYFRQVANSPRRSSLIQNEF